MKAKFIHITLICYLLSITAIAQIGLNPNAITILNTKNDFTAGDTIALRFTLPKGTKPNLYCTNSYGSTLISPSIKNQTLVYTLPKHISNKSGSIYWKLISHETSLFGQFNIRSKPNVASIETYIGPPSVQAGQNDYTMAVVIPTDTLDNPLNTNTKVTVKHQFLDTVVNATVINNNIIAYSNITSKQKSGRILISSEVLGKNSKEFTVDVLPSLPTNFTIGYNQNHSYADGNQITTFFTSTLKDRYGNTVIDGTYVTFFVRNKAGAVLKTFGTTINGVAKSEMLHPSNPESWTVKAFVNGMAESNTITLNYKEAIKTFNVHFSKNNRTITVGPLKSFMKQLIPNGLQVVAFVYKHNTLVHKYNGASKQGLVTFNLKKNLIKNDTYNIKIQVAGLEKTFNAKILW